MHCRNCNIPMVESVAGEVESPRPTLSTGELLLGVSAPVAPRRATFTGPCLKCPACGHLVPIAAAVPHTV